MQNVQIDTLQIPISFFMVVHPTLIYNYIIVFAYSKEFGITWLDWYRVTVNIQKKVRKILTLTPRSNPTPLSIIFTSGQALAHDLVPSLAAVLHQRTDTVAVPNRGADWGPDERSSVVAVVASHGDDTVLWYHRIRAPDF